MILSYFYRKTLDFSMMPGSTLLLNRDRYSAYYIISFLLSLSFSNNVTALSNVIRESYINIELDFVTLFGILMSLSYIKYLQRRFCNSYSIMISYMSILVLMRACLVLGESMLKSSDLI